MWKIKYPCQKICCNGNEKCGVEDYKNCVRFMPLKETNLTWVIGIVETPPDIDCNKFHQYFSNWIKAMGWKFNGNFKPYEDEEYKNEET